MRLTSNGRVAAGLTLLTLLAALASGNNLLYLLYSVMLAAFAVCALSLPLNLRGLRVEAEFPEHLFRGSTVRLRLRLANDGPLPAYWVRARCGASEAFLPRLGPGEEARLELEAALPHRGLNRLEGLALESAFPFGLLRRSRAFSAVGTAWPRPRAARSAKELSFDSLEGGTPRPRKGGGDEFFGPRAYDPSDDSRLINWKLSARTGRILVNEYSEPGGTRVTLRVPPGAGEAFEAAVIEAASACKYFVETGAEVRLLAEGTEVAYGKGLLHLDRLLAALALLGDGSRPRPVPLGAPPPPEAGLPPGLPETGLLLAALVTAGLQLIEEIGPALTLPLWPAIAAAWWLDPRGPRQPRIPEFLWQAVSAVVLLYILLVDWRASGVTVANTHLLIYLLLNRLLAAKGRYEHRQLFLVYFLAFFLIAGQTISPWFFPAFLAFAALAALWLLLEAAPARGADADAPSPLAPAWGLAAATLACLLAGGLGFAATPRLDPLRRMNPFVAMGLDKRQPKEEFVVGFTENVGLGFFGQLKKSPARVMRVKPVVPAGRPELALRIRGSAFDEFDGRRWRKTQLGFVYRVGRGLYLAKAGEPGWVPRRGGTLVFPGPPRPKGRTLYEVMVLPLNSAVLFTVDGALAVEEERAAAYFDYTDTAYFGSPYLGGLTYRVYGSTGAAAGYWPYVEDYERQVLPRFLQLPSEMPRVRELAQKVTRNARTPLEKARAVERFLQRGYSYSTYSADRGRTLEQFLFSARQGNCEYFATAAAVLLRHAGVPSRLVTGFLADQWNEYGLFYDVRQGGAHAWTEAFVPDRGWVTVDATPPASALGERTQALLGRLGRLADAVQLRWYRDIIGYDRYVQRDRFHRFRANIRLDTVLDAIAVGWKACLGAGALWAAWALAPRLRRRLRRRPRPFERALDLLERKGLRAEPHQTPREFAEAVGAARPPLAEPLRGLSDLHYVDRYSGRPLSAEEARRAEALLAEIRDRA